MASEGLFESLLVLLVMVGLIVVTIALSDWAMTKLLGYTMFFFYVSTDHILIPRQKLIPTQAAKLLRIPSCTTTAAAAAAAATTTATAALTLPIAYTLPSWPPPVAVRLRWLRAGSHSVASLHHPHLLTR